MMEELPKDFWNITLKTLESRAKKGCRHHLAHLEKVKVHVIDGEEVDRPESTEEEHRNYLYRECVDEFINEILFGDGLPSREGIFIKGNYKKFLNVWKNESELDYKRYLNKSISNRIEHINAKEKPIGHRLHDNLQKVLINLADNSRLAVILKRKNEGEEKKQVFSFGPLDTHAERVCPPLETIKDHISQFFRPSSTDPIVTLNINKKPTFHPKPINKLILSLVDNGWCCTTNMLTDAIREVFPEAMDSFFESIDDDFKPVNNEADNKSFIDILDSNFEDPSGESADGKKNSNDGLLLEPTEIPVLSATLEKFHHTLPNRLYQRVWELHLENSMCEVWERNKDCYFAQQLQDEGFVVDKYRFCKIKKDILALLKKHLE